MTFPFVSTDWLAERLGSPGLVVIDASWHMPASGRDAQAEYLGGHIPGAIFFDIDAIADPATALPHMLPDPVSFSSAMRELGIGDGMRAVVYDSAGLFSAPRVWWTLRVFGMHEVFVLDGGLPQWKAENRPLEEGPVKRRPSHFTARMDHSLVANWTDVLHAARSDAAHVIDARAADRFRGEAPEPRPGLRKGHIPGSLNVPWTDLTSDGRMLGADAILGAFERAGVDWSKPLVTSCGSGVSAALLSLALEAIGRRSAVYDGSWTEWGGRDDLPLETG